MPVLLGLFAEKPTAIGEEKSSPAHKSTIVTDKLVELSLELLPDPPYAHPILCYFSFFSNFRTQNPG